MLKKQASLEDWCSKLTLEEDTNEPTSSQSHPSEQDVPYVSVKVVLIINIFYKIDFHITSTSSLENWLCV